MGLRQLLPLLSKDAKPRANSISPMGSLVSLSCYEGLLSEPLRSHFCCDIFNESVYSGCLCSYQVGSMQTVTTFLALRREA